LHPEFVTQPTDEILESIWTLQETDTATLPALLERLPDAETEALLRKVVEVGLARVDSGKLSLTSAGEVRARAIVRCHRLAERLLHDVLGLPVAECEDTACLMEHVLSPTVADAVCSFLGHPPTTPLGHAIPGGDCCAAGEKAMRPLVVALPDLELGKTARIVFMAAKNAERRVDRLGSYGVVPGSLIRLRQKRPSFVIELEGTSLALDGDVAREIYVRREA
jgi:DtxR family Mn-dependent transcriptional regulator